MDAGEMIARAEQRGMRVEYSSAILVVRRRPTKDRDVLDVEEKILRQLAEHQGEVERFARLRSIAARKDFIGRQCLSVDREILGTIERCDNDRLTMRYLVNAGGESERESTCSCDPDLTLIIVTGSDHPSLSIVLPPTVDEKTREFLKRAAGLGVRFEWDCFLVAKFRADRKVTAKMIREIDGSPAKPGDESWKVPCSRWPQRLEALSRVTADQARASRARDFLGATIFSQAIAAIGTGGDAKAIIKDFANGLFSVAGRSEMGPVNLLCDPRDLLVVLDEIEPAVSSSSAAAEPAPASFLSRVRSALTGNAG